MTARERLAKGEFNYMSQHLEPDGSVLVVMAKRGDPHVYRLWVRDLYQPNEIILREEVV